MSYILEALKKSERERQETPSIQQGLYEVSSDSNTVSLRRPRWPWLLLAGLLIMGVAWQLPHIGASWRGHEPAGKSSGQSTPSPAEVAPAGAPPASAPAATDEGQSTVRLALRSEWFDDLPERLPGKDIPASAAEALGNASLPATLMPQASKELKTLRKDREKILLDPREQGPVKRSPVLATAPGKPQAATAPPQADMSVGKPQSAGFTKSESSLPYLRDLPPRLQAEIPKLRFAGHAYSSEPSRRLIVINGTIMREGDHIDAVTRLEKITWEGVVIDRKGVRFQMKCY
jgi:general secretion pathway protein B